MDWSSSEEVSVRGLVVTAMNLHIMQQKRQEIYANDTGQHTKCTCNQNS